MTQMEELVLDVLVARHRLGESLWTFKTGYATTLRSLQDKGLVFVSHGVVEGTVRAGLTDEGKRLWMSDNYTPPTETQTEQLLHATEDALRDRNARLRRIERLARGDGILGC